MRSRICILLSFILLITIPANALRFHIHNPNPIAVVDAPVILPVSIVKGMNLSEHGIQIKVNGKSTPVQIDDLNRDGNPDEIVFLVNLEAGEKARVQLKTLKHPAPEPKSEVFTSLILKDENGKWLHKDEVSSDKNNMYNRLHHHGVAFESDKMAYRIYFDNKSTIDLYGKKTYRLELKDTYWYPTDAQLKEGYGDDILLVSGWVGIGTLKGWDGNTMKHIDKFSKRTHRILARGPLRAVVESEVEGWDYEGQLSTVTVRYLLYARHRDVVAEVRSNNNLNAVATGVQQIGGGELMNSANLVGAWGSWYPQPDTVKYAKETVGLGLYIPETIQKKQVQNGVNNLFVFPVQKDKIFRYYFTVIATKEKNQPIREASQFFNYLNQWKKGLEPIRLKL